MLMKIKILTPFILVIFNLINLSAQPKKIYIAPDNHTDYMWNSNEEGYRQAFLKTLDYYMDLNDSTANEPYPYQSKWNCDGSYWVYIYEKNRSAEQFDRLINQIRDGKITVPLNTLSGVHGIAPAEATIREMYYAGSLERRFGLELDLAINMEDNVLPLGLASLWAGAGAKYSWRGVCACATDVSGFESRRNEIYWYKGLDDQKILMKWYSLTDRSKVKGYSNQYFGGYSEARFPEESIELSKELMAGSKYPYNIIGAFGKGWDDIITITDEFPRIAKNKSDQEYQVIVSNKVDFFRDFEKSYGRDLPSETISYGSTDWGINVASLAGVAASVKRAVEKLRAAEGLYTLVALKDSEFANELTEMRERAWIACGLFFEHDWTADGPVTRKQRADWSRRVAGELGSYVDTLYNRSRERLGELISSPDNNNEVFYVYNPLGWTRTDYSDYLYNGPEDITVIDRITSREVPFQFVTGKDKKYLRILAGDIPSLGYKVFEIKKGSSAPGEPAAMVTDGVIENNYYKITVTSRGVITSLIDKTNNNRELISPENDRYANDLGSAKEESLLHDRPLRIENEGPVSVTLIAESYKPVKHISKITLFRNSDRIELENYITQNFGAGPEIYSFSFNITNPDTWHEEAGAILNVKPESEGGHYAERISRLDWIAINHFADMSGNGNGIVLSNRDAYFMKTGNSTLTSLDHTTSQINVLAGGQMERNRGLGIENQDGDSYFENFFALRPYTGSFNSTEAMKFALEHQNPLVAGKVSGTEGAYGDQFSLFTFSNPNVLAWSVKPAEEGIKNGIILRVWNMDNKDSECTVSSSGKIISARNTTHIETDGEAILPVAGTLNTIIGHNKMQTFRLFIN